MVFQLAIAIAKRNLTLAGEMESSASLCLADAIACYESGQIDRFWERILKSLSYSVGEFHEDWLEVKRASLI